MSIDTQADVLRWLAQVRQSARLAETALAEPELDKDIAPELRYQMDLACAKLKMVRDWLDEYIR